MSFAEFDVEFTKDGLVFDETLVQAVLDSADRFTDVLIISHGWNNNKEEARQLYDEFVANMTKVLETNTVQGLERRHIGIVRLYWPSKKFEDADLIPGGGAASIDAHEDEQTLLAMLDELKRNPVRLGDAEPDPIRETSLNAARDLVPQLKNDAAARRFFVLQLRAILDASQAHPDDGSLEFFTEEPEALFERLQVSVTAPLGRLAGGGAVALDQAGGAAGLKDIFEGVTAAARRLVNYTTYYEMKQRAGIVGRTGVVQLLQRLRDRNNQLRLHLVGHSFGGRLVTAAAHALPPGTPAVSISLLQAAYSHNGLAEKFDGRNDGAFRALITEGRASGPVVITYTKNDRAVGIAYPLASRITREQAAHLGDKDDPYGGMGRNGAQHTPELDSSSNALLPVGGQYHFVTGAVYNLNADEFVRNHGDVANPQVVYAVLNAVKCI